MLLCRQPSNAEPAKKNPEGCNSDFAEDLTADATLTQKCSPYSIKREVVATKEGGAITGEERIREHLDTVYGALNSWEGKPAAYQVERVDSLRRELADVEKEFEAATAGIPKK